MKRHSRARAATTTRASTTTTTSPARSPSCSTTRPRATASSTRARASRTPSSTTARASTSSTATWPAAATSWSTSAGSPGCRSPGSTSSSTGARSSTAAAEFLAAAVRAGSTRRVRRRTRARARPPCCRAASASSIPRCGWSSPRRCSRSTPPSRTWPPCRPGRPDPTVPASTCVASSPASCAWPPTSPSSARSATGRRCRCCSPSPSGVKGFTTIHAADARGALSRIRFLAELSESARNLPHSALTTLVGRRRRPRRVQPAGPRRAPGLGDPRRRGPRRKRRVGRLHRHRPVHTVGPRAGICAGPATCPTASPARSPARGRDVVALLDGRDEREAAIRPRRRDGGPAVIGVLAAVAAAYGAHLLYTALVLQWQGVGPGPARAATPRPATGPALRLAGPGRARHRGRRRVRRRHRRRVRARRHPRADPVRRPAPGAGGWALRRHVPGRRAPTAAGHAPVARPGRLAPDDRGAPGPHLLGRPLDPPGPVPGRGQRARGAAPGVRRRPARVAAHHRLRAQPRHPPGPPRRPDLRRHLRDPARRPRARRHRRRPAARRPGRGPPRGRPLPQGRPRPAGRRALRPPLRAARAPRDGGRRALRRQRPQRLPDPSRTGGRARRGGHGRRLLVLGRAA